MKDYCQKVLYPEINNQTEYFWETCATHFVGAARTYAVHQVTKTFPIGHFWYGGYNNRDWHKVFEWTMKSIGEVILVVGIIL